MNTLKYTGIILTFVAIISACTKTETEYWDNGKRKSEIEYKNGEIHGKAKWFFYDGGLKFEVNYKEGKLHGPSTRYYSNGNKQMLENYCNDMLNGKALEYNINGSISEEKNYVNDTLHGDYKLWFNNGTLQIDGRYSHGLYDGKWIYRDTYGNIVGIGDFSKGKGTQTGYNQLGKIIRRVNYKNNKKEGKEYYYDGEGNITKVIICKDDEPVKVIHNP